MKLLLLTLLVGTILVAFILGKVLKGIAKVTMSLLSVAIVFMVMMGTLTVFGVVDADDFSAVPVLSTVTGKVSAWSDDAKSTMNDIKEIKETVDDVKDKINETQEEIAEVFD